MNMKYFKFLPFYTLSLLPLKFLYFLSDLSFIVIFHLFKYRRNVVISNLIDAFPEKTESEIKKIEKDFYRHFCDVFVEAVKCLTINKKEARKRLLIGNYEMIENYYNQNKSIILYMAHFGNWEWLCFLPLFVPHQVTTFYQELSNKYFDQLMQTIRSRFGIICYESKSGYKSLVELDRNNVLYLNLMVGDQSPGKSSPKHWGNFLNRETAFLIGADRIAKKLNNVVIYPSFKKLKRGQYELEFSLLASNPAEMEHSQIINSYINKLEESIDQSPELWLWSHRRWKLKR